MPKYLLIKKLFLKSNFLFKRNKLLRLHSHRGQCLTMSKIYMNEINGII